MRFTWLFWDFSIYSDKRNIGRVGIRVDAVAGGCEFDQTDEAVGGERLSVVVRVFFSGVRFGSGRGLVVGAATG